MRGPTPGFRGHLITAIVGTVGAIATFLMFFIGGGGADLGEKYQVRALVPTVNALAPGARVTMAGAKVGRVAEIRRHGVGTEVRLDITDDRVTPVPLDSRITVRQRTPVGENYVSIAPGRSRSMLASGGVLPPEQSDEYVDVDQVLSVLSGPTRERARKVIRSLGGPLRGRGEELHRIVGGGSQSLQSGARVLEILSPDREQIAALVRRLGAVSSEVQDSSRTVATLATKGLRSTQALAARDDALRRTLEELPGTLRQARTTSERLSTASAVATPVVANLAARLSGPCARPRRRGVVRCARCRRRHGRWRGPSSACAPCRVRSSTRCRNSTRRSASSTRPCGSSSPTRATRWRRSRASARRPTATTPSATSYG